MPTNPTHTTGTAAGIAGALVVLLAAGFKVALGWDTPVAVSGAETYLLTYALAAWLHFPPTQGL
jgi:hypothetical protein